MPKLRIEESATLRQARIDRGEETIVGVNKYQQDEETEIDILDIDNAAVREAQIQRLETVRSSRDEAACNEALLALTESAEKETGNLLALAVDAARARATVGEISDALEKIYGRHRAVTQSISGVYGAVYENDDEFAALRQRTVEFEKSEGRRPRMLICKLGQDGHDRGAKVIATAFAQAAGHKTLVPQVIAGLEKEGANDIVVICGGVIPPQDVEGLLGGGVSAVFAPGTNILEAAAEVLDIIEKRRLAHA
jgi:methylmalonyl-CoA mutase